MDGTFLAYGPTKNLPQLTAWLARINSQLALQEVTPSPDTSASAV